MKVLVDYKDVAINSAVDFMLKTNDFNKGTLKILVNSICKNLGVVSDNENAGLVTDAWIELLVKKGESEGYDGSCYRNGVYGFDSCGRSIRDWVIGIAENKELAAMSFDAGREFGEQLEKRGE